MKRSTETVLRAEIADAEKALDQARKRRTKAIETVTIAKRAERDAEAAVVEAEARRDRADAALAAYLPLPIAKEAE